VGEEVIDESEMREMLAAKPLFYCYDGFEPSGRMHIAQGIMKAAIVNKITSAGGVFIFWVADVFAFLNNKMGGNFDKI
jgi:tyrosyl-tRNA synthetase